MAFVALFLFCQPTLALERVKVGAAWSSSDLPLLFVIDRDYCRNEGLDVAADLTEAS